MTKVVFNRTAPVLDRDSFLTPFDKVFDQIVAAQFPEMAKTVGVNPMQGSAYPKVNVYEYDDKVGVVAEIPGLDKKDLSIDVEDGILTIAGNKHGLFDDAGAKAFEQGLRTLTVQVKGPGSGRETALRSLQSRGFKILSIKDTTPMPHNGARPPKRRRV